MTLIEKLKASAAALAEETAKGGEMDTERLAKLVDEHATLLGSEEAKGYGELPAMLKQIEQLRADVDAQAEAIKAARDLDLRIGREGQVRMPEGIDARRQMLADGRAFASDETAKRFGAYAAWRLVTTNPDPDIKGASLPRRTLEVCEDVLKTDGYDAEISGGRIRVKGRADKAGDIDPSVSGSGAELTSNEFRRELIRNVDAAGTIFPLCRRVPLMTLQRTRFPQRTGGFTMYWVAVAAEGTRSGMTFTTVDLTPEKGMVLTGIPNEMYRDPGLLVDIGNLVGVEATFCIAGGMDDVVVNGDGTADYGGFTGILESANIASQSADATHTTVATLDGEDVGNVHAALPLGIALRNARWAMSNGVKGVLRNLRTTTGAPLYDRGNGQREPATIDGYPYTLGTACPTVAAAATGNPYAIFGDFRMAYYVGMLRSIEIAASEHVYFTSDMTAVRALAHVAFAEAEADALVVAKTAGA